MKAVVVYESMYRNTHQIADAIGAGLRESMDVEVVPVQEADRALAGGSVGLLVVGGPTHAHSMSRVATREAAAEDAAKPGSALVLDASAGGPGVRDWLRDGPPIGLPAAAFDTRIDVKRWLSGAASKGIAKRLRSRECSMVASPESFVVDKHNVLESGELERARQWGSTLGATRRTTQHH